MNPEKLLTENMALVGQVVAFVCRRYGVGADDHEEFAAHVNLKLVENDYAILQKFQGRSSLRTYLTVVVQRLFLDFRIARWGKWRPSAKARRLGSTAIRLEALLYREKHSLEEAVEILGTNFEQRTSLAALRDLAAELPPRLPRRFEDSSGLAAVPVFDSPEDALARTEEERVRTKVETSLQRAMGTLKPEDRLLLRLRYQDDIKVVDIARTMGVEQKPLYRRLDRIRNQLKRVMEEDGCDAERVLSLTGDVEAEWSGLFLQRQGENPD